MNSSHEPNVKPTVYDPKMKTLRDPETGRLLKNPNSKRALARARRMRKRAPVGPLPHVEEAREAGTLPEKVPQKHGGALYRGGVPGNKGGEKRAQLDHSLRDLARVELSKMVEYAVKDYYGYEPVPVVCGNASCNTSPILCPDCGQPLFMQQVSTTPHQRMQIMEGLRKIAGIEKVSPDSSTGSEPFIIQVAGSHPAHVTDRETDGAEQATGG